jgi:hypothetical protein
LSGTKNSLIFPGQIEMETLPLENIWQIALQLNPASLLNFCRTNRTYAELCQNETFLKEYLNQDPELPAIFWSQKAYHDFGFPIEAFPFAGDPDLSAADRYRYISGYRPPQDHFLLLNQMAPQWNQYTETWDRQLNLDYPMEPTLYPDTNLHSLPPMTEEQANEFLDSLDDLSGDPFIRSNHLYLNLDYNMYRHVKGFKGTVHLRVPRQTLIRGDGNDDITYEEILKNTRNLFPSIDFGGIEQYTWDGFSPDGIPQLKVTIDF